MQRGSRIAVAFTVITFVLHWMWEIAHGPAYVDTAIPLEQRVWHCLPMALVDTAWSGGIIALILVMTRARALGIAAVAGAATAVLLERFALDTGRWTYNQMMPIVPVVNVGLWPVVQMALITPVALVLARAYVRLSVKPTD